MWRSVSAVDGARCVTTGLASLREKWSADNLDMELEVSWNSNKITCQ